MFNHKDKNELSKSTCQTTADFPSNQIVPSRDCSAHLRSSLRRLASGLQRIPYPPRMPIEVTVQNFPVLVVTGIMVLKKNTSYISMLEVAIKPTSQTPGSNEI